MKIYYSSYELNSFSKLNSRSSFSRRMGFLLKVIWDNGFIGYSDCHPLIEYGDLPTWTQIEELRRGTPSDLLKRSLWMASWDAEYRSKGQNIYQALPSLKNNFVITDIDSIVNDDLEKLKAEGFTHLKIKVGHDFKLEIQFIEKVTRFGFKIRLDFNSSSQFLLFKEFIGQLSDTALESIEYIEDPFPFDKKLWIEAQKLTKIAVDFEYSKIKWDQLESIPFDVVIMKPARMNITEVVSECLKHDLNFTVTSSMDHPLGCLGALSLAMDLKTKYGESILDPGCMTWPLFARTQYSDSIIVRGPEVMEVPGAGLGFDRLLEGQEWHEVL